MKKLLLGAAMVMILVGSIPVASAANPLPEIQRQIENLLQKLQGDAIPVVTECTIPSAPLALGSYGPEVKKLQIWLGQNGYQVVPAGKESQYFGPLTHFALIKFQSAAGIRPVSGFYGPITKAEIEKRCAVVAQTTRGLTVRLSDDTPDKGVVARGAKRVPVLAVTLTGESVLNSLTLHHYGVGKSSGFERVYLYDGNVRLTEGASVDPATDEITISDIALPISGSKTLTVMADFSAKNSTNNDGFEIISGSSVNAEGIVVGSFPIRGNLFTRLDQTVGSLVIARGLVPEAPVVGQVGAPLAELRISPGMREDALLYSITLAVRGSVNPALISNFSLQYQGETVALTSAVNVRNQIVLEFLKPILLTKGVAQKLLLTADIGAGVEVGDTLHLYIESSADVYAMGATSGFGITVNATGYNNSGQDGSDASWQTIAGGTLLVAFRGPLVANYTVNQRDVELMRFDVKAQDNLEVRRTQIMLTAGGSDGAASLETVNGLCNMAKANYTDIKLVDALTGVVITRALDTKCAVSAQDVIKTLVFNDPWRINAGQMRTLKIVADIESFVPVANETIRATLLTIESKDVYDFNTADYVKQREIIPTGNLAGAAHRVYASPSAAADAVALGETTSITN